MHLGRRPLLRASSACLVVSLVLFAVADSVSDRAVAACGGGWACMFAGFEGIGWAIAGFAFLIAALVLASVVLLRWIVTKRREQVAAQDVRRLEREVARLEKELAEE